MKRSVIHIALCLLTITAFAQGAENESALNIVNKAIKNSGGRKALAKYSSMTWKDKGMYYGMGAGIPYTGTYAAKFPYKFRMTIEGVFTIVLNGDKGWVNAMGETTEMEKDRVAEEKEQHYSGWVTTLLPLSKKPFKLSIIGDSKIGDVDATGVTASSKGHRDVELYFDKKSGLLIKSQYSIKSEELGGKEVQFEVFYGEYKDFDGAKFSTSLLMKQDGKKYVQSEQSEMTPAEFDKDAFAKP